MKTRLLPRMLGALETTTGRGTIPRCKESKLATPTASAHTSRPHLRSNAPFSKGAEDSCGAAQIPLHAMPPGPVHVLQVKVQLVVKVRDERQRALILQQRLHQRYLHAGCVNVQLKDHKVPRLCRCLENAERVAGALQIGCAKVIKVRGCNELSGHALKVLKARARRVLPCINICKVEAGRGGAQRAVGGREGARQSARGAAGAWQVAPAHATHPRSWYRSTSQRVPGQPSDSPLYVLAPASSRMALRGCPAARAAASAAAAAATAAPSNITVSLGCSVSPRPESNSSGVKTFRAQGARGSRSMPARGATCASQRAPVHESRKARREKTSGRAASAAACCARPCLVRGRTAFCSAPTAIQACMGSTKDGETVSSQKERVGKEAGSSAATCAAQDASSSEG